MKQITTAEELEAVPVGAILRGDDGRAVERGRSRAFWVAGYDVPFTPAVVLRVAPLTLLWPVDGGDGA